MNLQIINSVDGKAEYVLLPIDAYEKLKPQINKLLDEDFVDFDVNNYVSNPVTLARIKAQLTQKELARAMNVSQSYISKLEKQGNVSTKTLQKIYKAISKD